MAYCKHAHRSTIELADVELLMKRFVLALHLSHMLIKKLHVIHMYFKEKYTEKILGNLPFLLKHKKGLHLEI